MTTSDQIIARLRRKAEIVRLDTKARQDAVHHDMNEILSLLDMLERTLAKGSNPMGQRTQKEQFATEAEAQARADKVKASATPGYSEVYVSGPFCVSGVWMIEWKEYYG